jgi:hypothetical protein
MSESGDLQGNNGGLLARLIKFAFYRMRRKTPRVSDGDIRRSPLGERL